VVRGCKRQEAGRGRLSDLLCGQMLQDWGEWELRAARARARRRDCLEKGEGEKESEPVPAHRRVFSSARVSAAEELARALANQGGGLDLEQDGVDGKVTHTQHSHATNTDVSVRRPHDAVGGGGTGNLEQGKD
jgi:hypothetical protein